MLTLPLPLLLSLLPLIAATRSTLLITPRTTSLPDCIQSSYHGTYGSSQEAIFYPSQECLINSAALDALDSGSLVPFDSDDVDAQALRGRTLMWVGEAGLAFAPKGQVQQAWPEILERSLEFSLYADIPFGDNEQIVLSSKDPQFSKQLQPQLIYSSPSMLLVAIHPMMIAEFSAYLPAHLVPVVVPMERDDARSMEWETVPANQVAFLADLTKNATFDARIDRIVESIDVDEIRRDVRYLTGEGPSGITSRHSFTEGARQAAHWIKDQATSYGANCTLETFLPGFSPNVICHYSTPSARNHTVIVSAHYDSRGSFGSTRAPGGNDDGSGSGHLLALARAIGKANLTFESQVTLAWFAGEEQGLFGSHAYAAKLKLEKREVALQIQADMLAYHVPGETLQLALPESIGLPEAGYLLGNLSRIYSPELVIGTTPACCSDHQNFVANGFPATAVYERNGDIADPEYHCSGDLSQRQGYDFTQIRSIAKVTLAALLETAGFIVA